MKPIVSLLVFCLCLTFGCAQYLEHSDRVETLAASVTSDVTIEHVVAATALSTPTTSPEPTFTPISTPVLAPKSTPEYSEQGLYFQEAGNLYLRSFPTNQVDLVIENLDQIVAYADDYILYLREKFEDGPVDLLAYLLPSQEEIVLATLDEHPRGTYISPNKRWLVLSFYGRTGPDHIQVYELIESESLSLDGPIFSADASLFANEVTWSSDNSLHWYTREGIFSLHPADVLENPLRSPEIIQPERKTYDHPGGGIAESIIFPLEWSVNGEYLLAVEYLYEGGPMVLIERESNRLIDIPNAHYGFVPDSVLWLTEAKFVHFSLRGTATVWRVEPDTPELIQLEESFEIPSGYKGSFKLLPNGRLRFASGTFSGQSDAGLYELDLKTWELLRLSKNYSEAYQLNWINSPVQVIWSADNQSALVVLDIRSDVVANRYVLLVEDFARRNSVILPAGTLPGWSCCWHWVEEISGISESEMEPTAVASPAAQACPQVDRSMVFLLPDKPETVEDSLLNFLNQGGSWEAVLYTFKKRGMDHELAEIEFDGQAPPEKVLYAQTVDNYGSRVHVWLLLQCRHGRYVVPVSRWANYAFHREIKAVDLNQDGREEIVLARGFAGSACSLEPIVWMWGEIWVRELSPSIYELNIDCTSSDVWFADMVGDGRLEMILHGDTVYHVDNALPRVLTQTFGLEDEGYRLLQTEYAPPVMRVELLQDAQLALDAQDLERALALYAEAVYTNLPTVDGIEIRLGAHLREPSVSHAKTYQQAFALFRLIVLNTAVGDAAAAERYFTKLTKLTAVDSPGSEFRLFSTRYLKRVRQGVEARSACVQALETEPSYFEFGQENPGLRYQFDWGYPLPIYTSPEDFCPLLDSWPPSELHFFSGKQR